VENDLEVPEENCDHRLRQPRWQVAQSLIHLPGDDHRDVLYQIADETPRWIII
jgi:hypothetical protein